MAAFAATGYHMVKVDGKYQPVRISDGQPLGVTNANEEIDGAGSLPLRFEVCKKPKGSAGRGPPDGYNLQVALQMPDADYKIFRSDLTAILWQCKAINMTEPVTKQSRDALVHCLKKFVSKHPEFEEFRELRFWCIWAAMGMVLRQSASRTQRDKARRQAGFSLPKITTRKRGRPRKQAADTPQVKSTITGEKAPGDPSPTQDVHGTDKTIDTTELQNSGPDAEDTTNPPQDALGGPTRVSGDISLIDTSMLDSSAIDPPGSQSVDMSRDLEDDEDEEDGEQFDISKTQAIALKKPVPHSVAPSAPVKSPDCTSTSRAPTPVPNGASKARSRATTSLTTSDPITAPIPTSGSAPSPPPGSTQDVPGAQATGRPAVTKDVAPPTAQSPADIVAADSPKDDTPGSVSLSDIGQESSESIIIWHGNEYTSEEVAQIRKYAHRVTIGDIKRVPAVYKEFIYKFVDNPNYNPSTDALPPPPPTRGQGGARARKTASSPAPTPTSPVNDSTAPDIASMPPPPVAKSKPKPRPKAKVVDHTTVADPVSSTLGIDKGAVDKQAPGTGANKGKAVAAGEHGAARTNPTTKQKAGHTQPSTDVEQPVSSSRRSTRKKV
ncbi:hypothetical protein RhiJN_09034 [Ceratobasidium sp. AG-Ba]|nr:hypothetical protein RhiJN_09034 [Ceratobasidium sp. AG-Ba]